MSPFVFVVLQTSIVAYALVGGVFLAFSDFIMRSLAHTSGVGGVEAMQVINREVFRWVFMTLFLGMAAVSVFTIIYFATNIAGGASFLIILGALVYLLGCFAVTVFFNVPMNETLSDMDVTSDAAQAYWVSTYVPRWTMWNTVRTVACALSATMTLVGLLWLTQVEFRLV